MEKFLEKYGTRSASFLIMEAAELLAAKPNLQATLVELAADLREGLEVVRNKHLGPG